MQRTHTPATGAGFTLIEILVVMAIIGMLAVMVAPNIFNQQAGARRGIRRRLRLRVQVVRAMRPV